MNPWSTIYRAVWVALGVLALIGLSFMFVPLFQQDRELRETEAQLHQAIRHNEAEIRRYKEQQERFQNDPAFVERIAHEIGLAKPDETIFRFIDETDEPSVTP
jgi:cell division protein FtsB